MSGVLTTLLTSFSEENTVIILTSRWRRSTVVLGSTGTPLYSQCQTDCDQRELISDGPSRRGRLQIVALWSKLIAKVYYTLQMLIVRMAAAHTAADV